ncbi:hypothetical protein KsCSTR_04830 [Candidatus Kuenenia stuttgartiensis]|uniref:Uncharacterized protein n=1 Tax=Kuenenia stuttgartiensis TaxID=174633 RepID=Q1Q099_KUEST|nr:hypothetical protein KsCSTR_04830 [Candidatus Kuenenia stuttgartiensis]CAJ72761.1 unknown protein [Candidatus Kuenenia stuttgartiensis]
MFDYNSEISCKVTQASGLSFKYQKQEAYETIMILKAERKQQPFFLKRTYLWKIKTYYPKNRGVIRQFLFANT